MQAVDTYVKALCSAARRRARMLTFRPHELGYLCHSGGTRICLSPKLEKLRISVASG